MCKSLRNGLASNAFVYTNVKDSCQGFPETLCRTRESAFCSGERNRVLGGLPLTSILYLWYTNTLLAVPLRSRYDKDQLYRMGYQSYSHVREKADLYKHKSISVFADDHISFCYEIELNTRSVDRYPGPLGMTRSGRLGDCNKDNSIPVASSRTKHIIVLSILFTSLSDTIHKLMFFCI